MHSPGTSPLCSLPSGPIVTPTPTETSRRGLLLGTLLRQLIPEQALDGAISVNNRVKADLLRGILLIIKSANE